MKKYKLIIQFLVISFLAISCEDFLEIDTPAHQLPTALVFENDETAMSALQGVYNQLFRSGYFANGYNSSVTTLAGLSSGNLVPVDETKTVFLEFLNHEISPQNINNYQLWSSAYNIIYMVNSLLEGVEASKTISTELAKSIKGQALFIRGFTYFYLKQIYGEVPLVLTTNYNKNALISSATTTEIHHQLLSDLKIADELLAVDYLEQERTYVNQFVVKALLARIALYDEDWQLALEYSNQVIAQTTLYNLEENVNDVFLANSKEAIWQISPLGGGNSTTNTHEWTIFSSSFPQLHLKNNFTDIFNNIDLRLSAWLQYKSDKEVYHPYKYKNDNTNTSITEYSMVLRLAEQYFIRAEAQAQLGNMPAAIAAIDHIRERAGIPLIAQSQPQISKEDFLTLLLEERERELFSEWGHRWLDLKRTNKATEVLLPANTLWQETDVFYPIPEEERIKNPNLTQNPGY